MLTFEVLTGSEKEATKIRNKLEKQVSNSHFENDNLVYKEICKLIAPEYIKYCGKVYKNKLNESNYCILIDKNNYAKLQVMQEEVKIVFQGIEIKSIDLDFEFCKIIKIKGV